LSFLNPAGRGTGSGKKARVATAFALGGALLGGGSCGRGDAAAGRPLRALSPTTGAAAAVALGGALPEPNRAISVGDAVPDFTLTDQTGRAVRLSQFRGEPVAVTFAYTRCPDATACPMTMQKFATLNAALAKEKNGRLLAVTVDPETDTPAVLADFARRIGADPERWRFLTGDARALARVAETFGVLYYPEHGKIVHSQAVAVVDPDGRLAAVYYGSAWEPEQILKDLEKARNG
jgi:protein SCO1